MGESETTPTDTTETMTRRGLTLFDRRVLTMGALVVTLTVLAVFWYLGASWANGQALAAVLVVMAIWLVAGSTVRHRFRFGLRTILVLMTVAAVLFAVVGKHWYDIQDRRRAIVALEPMGASVQYGFNRQGDWFTSSDGWLLPVWLVDILGEDFFADPYALSLTQPQLDNDVLAEVDISGFPYVYICWNNLNDDGAAAFEGLIELDSLQLNNTAITDDGLAHLSGCANLTFLDLSNNSISDIGLQHLAGLTKLQRLDLDGTRVTGTGLMQLRGGMLTMVDLSGAPVTSEGIAELGQLPALSYLVLSATNVTDADLAHLSDLTNLQYLYLTNTNVGDTGMAHLASLSNLESLDLAATLVGDEGLERLANMKRLGTLNLNGTAVTDAGLVHLEQLVTLRQLNLEQTGVTSAGVERLKLALPECDIEWTPPVSARDAPMTEFRPISPAASGTLRGARLDCRRLDVTTIPAQITRRTR